MALIERHQPYQPTDAGRMMGYLRALSDIDKHRIIIPAPMLPAYGEVNIKYYDWAELILNLDRYELGQKIKKDTKIHSIVLAGNPPLICLVHVDASTTIIPVFLVELIKPTPPDDVVDVEFTLDTIAKLCSDILTEAQNYF